MLCIIKRRKRYDQCIGSGNHRKVDLSRHIGQEGMLVIGDIENRIVEDRGRGVERGGGDDPYRAVMMGVGIPECCEISRHPDMDTFNVSLGDLGLHSHRVEVGQPEENRRRLTGIQGLALACLDLGHAAADRRIDLGVIKASLGGIESPLGLVDLGAKGFKRSLGA